jgi:hypothetical protein
MKTVASSLLAGVFLVGLTFGNAACGSAAGGGEGGGGGNGGGVGNGGNGGTVSGAYNGTWSGNTTNTSCADTAGFTTANYCAQLRGAVVPMTLDIVQGPASATPCVTISNAPLFGNAQGGCATSTTPKIIATVGSGGDLMFTGVLSGMAGSPFNALTLTIFVMGFARNGHRHDWYLGRDDYVRIGLGKCERAVLTDRDDSDQHNGIVP